MPLAKTSTSPDPSTSAGAQFLSKKFSTLPQSENVANAIKRAKNHREVSGDLSPTKRVQVYSDLVNRILHLPEDQKVRGNFLDSVSQHYIQNAVIKEENIPERAYELEQEIAFAQGHGVIHLTPEYKRQKNQEILAGQKHSLSEWLNYLGSKDALYPTWAKIWVLESVIKLGRYNKEQGKFEGRTKDTTVPFPLLNIGALAKAIETIEKKILRAKIENHTNLSDEDFAKLLQKEDFGSLYALYLGSQKEYSKSGLENIQGEWICYKKGSAPDKLYDSLQGHPLEWCTAQNISTARTQLQGGDFYVYYSQDEHKENRIPRIAIRMEGDRIAEVRGIQARQEMDLYILPVLEEKMKDFGEEGKLYLKRASDMKRLHQLFERQIKVVDLKEKIFEPKKDALKLTKDELLWLLQIDQRINGFGYNGSNHYNNDPRIATILSHQNIEALLEEYYGNKIIDGSEESLIFITKVIARCLDLKLLNFIPFVDYHKEIVLKLIEAEEGPSVACNLQNFQGLDREIALKLIEAKQGPSVACNLQNFQGLNHKEIALKLIEAKQGQSVAYNLEKFQGLDHKEIAFKLFEAGAGEFVAYNLQNFQGLDHKEIAFKLFEAGKGGYVAANLEQFQGLDHKEIALKLIETEQGSSVATYLEQFQGLDHKEIALKLIEVGKESFVVHNLQKFQGLDKEIAFKLIEAGELGSVAHNLQKFQGLDREIALKLIETIQGWTVAAYLRKFQGLDHKEIALKLIEVGKGYSVAAYLENFQGLDHKEIALKLMEAGEGKYIAQNLKKFQGLNHKDLIIIKKLAEHGLSYVLYRVSKKLRDGIVRFKGLFMRN